MKQLGILSLPLLLVAAACSTQAPPDAASEDAFQGATTDLVQLEFDTTVRAETADQAKGLLTAQLYWLVGPAHVNGGDPRLTWAESKVTKAEDVTTPKSEGVATFHVKLPMAWPKDKAAPAKYDLVLPARLDSTSQSAFFDKYKGKCIDDSDKETDYTNAWYEFTPDRSACQLADDDVVRIKAAVTKIASTKDKYPEYDRIWADDTFSAVVVYGRDKPGSTSDSDSGFVDYRKFLAGVKALPSLTEVVAKDEEFDDDGHTDRHATIDGKLPNGRSVHVTAFLLSKPSWAGDAFSNLYDPETESADFVAFAGHAGLGGNIQKLQSLGRYKKGQYQLFMYDGCDTFAYIDRTLFDKKRAANVDVEDPSGTRDLDVLLNALPAPWTYGDPTMLKVVRMLVDDAHPSSYETILKEFPRSGAPLVVGEEDNAYQPPSPSPRR